MNVISKALCLAGSAALGGIIVWGAVTPNGYRELGHQVNFCVDMEFKFCNLDLGSVQFNFDPGYRMESLQTGRHQHGLVQFNNF